MHTAKPAYSHNASPQHDIYWRDTESVSPGPPLTEDLDCDICIIGGGYTGMWSAHFLKTADSALDVHILEADYAGAGASGHNDGFVTGTIGGHTWHSLARHCGPERATAAHAAVARSIMAIYRFSCDQQFGIDIEPLGHYLVATSRRQDKRLADSHARAARLSTAVALPPILDGAAMRARIGSPAITSGVWKAGMLINPHKLARGLARSVEKAGATIHEQTPVIGLRDDGRSVILKTPSATVRARRVVLAANAWQGDFPYFQRKVLPLWHYALVTAPLADNDLRALNWRGREGFVEARRPSIFGRLTADNRILFGGGAVWERHDAGAGPGSGTKRIELILCEGFARYFPMLQHVPVTHLYGGAMGVTPDRMPSVGRISPRVIYAYGYSGNGIPVSHAVGQLVRDLVLGKDSPDWGKVFTRADEKRFRPHPLPLLAAKSRSYFSRI